MELREMIEARNKKVEKLNKERELINKLEQKLEYHKKKETKMWCNSGYIENILIPLGEEIKKRCNFEYFEIFGPFGLTCETTLYFSNVGKHLKTSKQDDIDICNVETWSLQLTYNDKYESGYQYWNGEVTNKYAKGSIGELNGENNVYVELPMDIDEIIKILRHNVK